MSSPSSSYPGPVAPRGSVPEETRRDAEAALAARRELGPAYDDQLAAGLADRVEELVSYRTAELRHAAERERMGSSLERSAQTQRFVSALVSLTAGIPITGIAANEGGLLMTAVCWAGIVGVNLAQAFGSRRH